MTWVSSFCLVFTIVICLSPWLYFDAAVATAITVTAAVIGGFGLWGTTILVNARLLPSTEGYLDALTQEHPHKDVVVVAHSTPATHVLQGCRSIRC